MRQRWHALPRRRAGRQGRAQLIWKRRQRGAEEIRAVAGLAGRVGSVTDVGLAKPGLGAAALQPGVAEKLLRCGARGRVPGQRLRSRTWHTREPLLDLLATLHPRPAYKCDVRFLTTRLKHGATLCVHDNVAPYSPGLRCQACSFRTATRMRLQTGALASSWPHDCIAMQCVACVIQPPLPTCVMKSRAAADRCCGSQGCFSRMAA